MVPFDFSLHLPSVYKYKFKSLQTSVFKVFPIIKYKNIKNTQVIYFRYMSQFVSYFSPATLFQENYGDFTFLPDIEPKLNSTKMLCLD